MDPGIAEPAELAVLDVVERKIFASDHDEPLSEPTGHTENRLDSITLSLPGEDERTCIVEVDPKGKSLVSAQRVWIDSLHRAKVTPKLIGEARQHTGPFPIQSLKCRREG